MKKLLFKFISFLMLTTFLRAQDPFAQTGYPATPKFYESQRELKSFKGGPVNSSSFSMIFTPGGTLNTVSTGRTTMHIKNISMQLQEQGSQIPFGTEDSLSTLEQSSFFFRTSSFSRLKTGPTAIGMLESYTEIIPGSDRIRLYTRWTLSDSRTVRATYEFVVPGDYDSMTVRGGGGFKGFNAYSLPNGFDFSPENAAIDFIAKKTGSAFGLAAGTEVCEARTWYVYDYVPRKLSRSLTIAKNSTGDFVVRIEIQSTQLRAGETIDQSFLVIPFAGNDNNIYHYYTTDISRGIARYFPREGFSTKWYSKHGWGFERYTHDSVGFTWGIPIYQMTYMENTGNKGDSLHGFYKDEQVRHLEAFFENQTDYGLLPFRFVADYTLKKTKDTSEVYPKFLFCQGGVSDIDFADQFLPTLTKEDALHWYSKISKVDSLFNPAKKYSWTVVQPSGAYWFEYSNLWKAEGTNINVVNSHVTALWIAASMRDLASKLGIDSEAAFWTNMVHKGIDGFLSYAMDEKNWGINPETKAYELTYAIHGQPTQHYHQEIMHQMQIMLNRNLIDYRKDEILKYLINKRKP